ncbi:MAG: hypothetical protein WBC82_10775, partial [Dehalococcoidia bacterium]
MLTTTGSDTIRFAMQVERNKEQELVPGDIVSHQSWGIGQVVEVGTGAEPDIVVDFPGKPHHRISSQLARHALSRLPSDGLEAQLLKYPEKVSEWSQNAPLKLIGSTLVDLGKAAKPGDLRQKLDSRHILRVKWESWWQRVQPTIKQSPHFLVRRDGSYELASPVQDIPEIPLPPVWKPREAKRTSLEIQEMVSKLEAGEIGFEGIKGAKTLRLVAREIVREGATSEPARIVMVKALAGPVLPSRFILEELSKSGRPTDLIEALVGLTNLLRESAVHITPEKSKNVGEHIAAKLRLIKGTTRRLSTQCKSLEDASGLSTFVEGLVGLALTIWREEMSSWRSESVDCASSTVTTLAEKQPEVFDIAGKYLARHEGGVSSKVGFADSLLAQVSTEGRPAAVDRLMTGSLTGSPAFVEECFMRHITKEDRLSWISSALQQTVSSCDSNAIEALSRLLLRTSFRLDADEQRVFVKLAIAVASLSYRAETDLASAISDGLRQMLDRMAPATSNLTSGKPDTVIDSIEGAYWKVLNREREQ